MNDKQSSHHPGYHKMHHRAPPGSSPGTLVADPSAPPPRMEVIAYGPDNFTRQSIKDVDEVQGFLGKWPVTWVNVDGLGDAHTIARLGEMFGLHPLALEDVVNVHQRPKVETYEGHYFMVVRMAVAERPSGDGAAEPVPRARLRPDVPGEAGRLFRPCARADPQRRSAHARARRRITWPTPCSTRSSTPTFPVLETFGERLEALEDEVLERAGPRRSHSEVHDAKRDLRRCCGGRSGRCGRRCQLALRDPLPSSATKRASTCATATTTPSRSSTCWRRTARSPSDLMDVYLSSVSNRMNEIMKVLTIISTIFIPLTFIAGIYGMNFNTGARPGTCRSSTGTSATRLPCCSWRCASWGWSSSSGAGGGWVAIRRRIAIRVPERVRV